MQKKHLILALLFGIPSVSFGAADPTANVKFQSSPYKACQDVGLITRDAYNKDKDFWDVAVKECGADVQVLPESGFLANLTRTIHGRFGGTGEENVRTEAFLRKVGEKALEYSEANNRLNEVTAACAAGDEAFLKAAADKETSADGKKFYSAEACKKRIEDVKDVVDEYGPKARVQYALMQKLSSLFGKAGKLLKTAFNMQTDLEKAPLSEAEKKEVEAKFAEINKRMTEKYDEEMKGLPLGDNPEAIMAATMDRIRSEELKPVAEEFTQIMQKAPMLAFISKSGRPTSADISAALNKVLENGKAESKKIRDAVAAADKGKGAQDRAKKMMEFMNYGPVLEEVLKSDPTFCQNGSTLADYIRNKEIGKAGLTMGVILATGFAGGAVASAVGAGAFVAGAVGTAASLAPTYKMVYEVDRDKYLAAYQRSFANAHSVEGRETAGKTLAEMKDFEEARDSLAMDIATSPLDLMGLGIGKGIVAGAAGAYTGAKMLAKPGAVRAAQKALLKKGFSALDAGKILADIKGTDAAKAAKALAILTDAVGVDAKELKVARNLVSKGVLREGDVEAFDRAMKTLREVKPEERAAVFARIDETLSNVNSAKINAANREQALEAIAAGSRFGAEPKYIAAKVTDWDGGLDGLARAYDVARQEMDTPMVRGLASDDLRRDAAFDSALRKLGVSDEKVRAQMKACGLGK